MKEPDSRIRNVSISPDQLTLELADGRIIGTPLSLYPTLKTASAADRSVFEVYPRSVHWPLLDVDLGIEGILAGAPELECYARNKGKRGLKGLSSQSK
jgi:hypothetical protein